MVKSGDRIPLDGNIILGETAIDESNLTGESKPIRKRVGDTVSAGTINVGSGFIIMKSSASSEDSAVAKLGRLVEEAATQRSETEQMVEMIAKVYTPTIVCIAILCAILPYFHLHSKPEQCLKTALILLVIACPCALVISTPITYVSGLTESARDGILIKGGKYLEALGKVTA